MDYSWKSNQLENRKESYGDHGNDSCCISHNTFEMKKPKSALQALASTETERVTLRHIKSIVYDLNDTQIHHIIKWIASSRRCVCNWCVSTSHPICVVILFFLFSISKIESFAPLRFSFFFFFVPYTELSTVFVFVVSVKCSINVKDIASSLNGHTFMQRLQLESAIELVFEMVEISLKTHGHTTHTHCSAFLSEWKHLKQG